MIEDSVVHNHVPKDFFGWGDKILRDINGQDHQTSMARINVSICLIWSWSS